MENDCRLFFNCYEKYINEEDDEVKVGFKEHVNSIKRHVEQLGNKNYQDLYQIESPDFYYLFLSNLLFALTMKISLYNKAFEKTLS
jgi:DNA recombination protein RmuC